MNEEIGRRYEADAPYPDVVVLCKNPKWGALISEDFAGAGSELTASTQYIYGNGVLRRKCPDVAEALRCISIVEMHHMEMLQQVILQLGCDPRYQARGRRWWCGADVGYACECVPVLRQSIRAEQAAIARYLRHIEIICDENVRCVLRRIVMDENLHLEILNELLQQHCPTGQV